MTDKIIRLDAAIEMARSAKPLSGTSDMQAGFKIARDAIVEALSALPAVGGWLPKAGDHVCYDKQGWIGVVEGHKSDQGIIWCRFEGGVGQYGVFPNELSPLPAPPIE